MQCTALTEACMNLSVHAVSNSLPVLDCGCLVCAAYPILQQVTTGIIDFWRR